ncbi:hypothetical protein PO78_3442 [Thauera sp. SWB20]|nr:hypothetical protein PO78_3442 [Thauera sp. SWB20]
MPPIPAMPPMPDMPPMPPMPDMPPMPPIPDMPPMPPIPDMPPMPPMPDMPPMPCCWAKTEPAMARVSALAATTISFFMAIPISTLIECLLVAWHPRMQVISTQQLLGQNGPKSYQSVYDFLTHWTIRPCRKN